VIKGSILCVTSCVPDLGAALDDYVGKLGLKLVYDGEVSEDDAESWDSPEVAGRPMASLQPVSLAECYIRLVEQPHDPHFRATQTYGWAAYEHTAEDAFQWPDKLAGSGFEIVGPPRRIAGLDHLIAMQMTGTGQEMLYLNEVRDNTDTTDLPKAKSPVDIVFICILAAKDRAKAVDWYRDVLGLDEAETHTIPYSSINRAFDLPADTQTSLTMMHNGRMPIIEIDGYPSVASPRPKQEGYLPPGNAIVSLAVPDIRAVPLTAITPIRAKQSGPFKGQLCACYRGPEGELLELIESSEET